jgi:adenylate cyclase
MHSDTVLAFFGPPFLGEEAHFEAACEAALAERHLRTSAAAAGAAPTGGTAIDGSDLHVALSVGPCIVGTMGSDVSKTFTAMGENVALTPFILAACDYYRIPILVVAEEEPSAVPNLVFRQLDYVVFPDRTRPVRLFELVGRKDDVDESTLELIRRYEEGAAALRERRWSDAIEALDACVALKPDDKPTQLLTERVDLYSFDPPPETWDGSWDLTGS